ncbi:LexA family protein [Thiomicrorhabdus cannonii]|uniref:LexA family protein n=1 Tax=Thiomicrorhabdus cannonii TaxID=2748011 RepID=UPI0015C08A81|nr:translesion error-prone DNA polymerase V autoproteolytic subunit [Thiomicrorhabdus cannonii]
MNQQNEPVDKPAGRGGARIGAGRKKGSGAFGEPTKVIRVPESQVEPVKQWLDQRLAQQKPSVGGETKTSAENSTGRVVDVNAERAARWQRALHKAPVKLFAPANESWVELPLYAHKVVAGFPSPADDYIETTLDLNDKLIRNKAATFLLVVEGDSMKKAGIKDGDILVVDRSIPPSDGKIVIAALDGELTVKRLSMKSTGTWLVPENDDYPPIAVREEADIVIWGVVTATISQF